MGGHFFLSVHLYELIEVALQGACNNAYPWYIELLKNARFLVNEKILKIDFKEYFSKLEFQVQLELVVNIHSKDKVKKARMFKKIGTFQRK
jgi:hypothetical protein